MPWEFERLQPVELWELMKGHQWRRNRDLEVVGTVLFAIRSMLNADENPDLLTRALPGYRPEKP